MLSESQLESLGKKIISLKDAPLPEEKDLQSFLENSLENLENESSEYRPLDSHKKAGGLLDFTESDLPVIVVPDIHGRCDFIIRLLEYRIPAMENISVLNALNEDRIIVVCVGDAVHGEKRAYERWVSSYDSYLSGDCVSETMQEEMRENFSVWQSLMLLKNSFPKNFHFLKGNHENVLNETGNGNYSFKKFVQEGQMCLEFIRHWYGDIILFLISYWEKALPVCAVFRDFAVSHAEPFSVFTKKEIINYKKNPEITESFTWTANDDVEDDTCQKILKKLCPKSKRNGVIWFGGHRPVMQAKYSLRQNSSYIQIHNPDEMNVAFVDPGRDFYPEKDIISL